MHLALFPKQFNLAVGAGIGVVIFIVCRTLVTATDNAPIWSILGVLGVIGGMYLAGSCAFRLWRPSPSFVADEEGFSVMGKRKQPWDKFQGVGVYTLKQYGMTTVQSVVVKVGKGPTFARKQHIKWTHLSDSAPDMAEQIHAYARKQMIKSTLDGMIAETEQATAMARATKNTPPMPTHDVAKAPQAARPVGQPVPPRRSGGDFSDGPIKSGGGGLRGLFGG